MNRKIVDYRSCDSPYISYEQHGDEYSLDIEYTLRSLTIEIRSCKVDNDKIIQSEERLARAHEKQV